MTAAEAPAPGLALFGASGRMGLAIVRIAKEAGFALVGGVVSSNSPHAGRDLGEMAGMGSIGVAASPDAASGLLGADVVIDFSTADAVPLMAEHALRQKIAIVSGTTRLGAAAEKKLDEAAKKVPVFWAPNTSLGVFVLAELAALAAKRLGSGFDVEIVETHHKAKVDAPSGTAVKLVAAVKEGRASLREVRGRDGNVGPRKSEEIGVHAVRGGDVIGEHTVLFLGNGERIELTHRATGRDLFARGALRAAAWILGKPPGRYTMADLAGG